MAADNPDDLYLIALEAWKLHVRDWLHAKGKTYRWLANQIDCSAAAVSQFLMPAAMRRRRGKKPIKNSALAASIARVTGIPVPPVHASPLMREWTAIGVAIEHRWPGRLEHLVRGFGKYADLLASAEEIERDLLVNWKENVRHGDEGNGRVTSPPPPAPPTPPALEDRKAPAVDEKDPASHGTEVHRPERPRRGR